MAILIKIIEMQIEDITEEINYGFDVDKNKLYRTFLTRLLELEKAELTREIDVTHKFKEKTRSGEEADK